MPHYTPLVLLAAVLAFGMYRRVRRTIGMQPILPGQLAFRAVLFLVLLAVVVAGAVAAGQVSTPAILSDAAGIVLGAGLVVVAARHTTLTEREGRWFYQTTTWVGVLVTTLFVARVAIRLVEAGGALSALTSQGGVPPAPGAFPGGGSAPFAGSPFAAADPWTAGLYLLFAVYYVGYYGYLLWRYRRERSDGAPSPA